MSTEYSIGLVSISFRKYTPREILAAMKSTSLTCIEWGSDVHAPCGETERLDEIVALQKQYGITCCSYGTYFRLGQTPIEELEGYIRAAKRLGTDVIRLWCGTKNAESMTADEQKAFLDECRKAAAIAKSHGVTLCMECHKGTFTERREDTLRLMAAVNSPHFQMYWQPFQWQSEEENVKNAGAIAPYAKRIHVFNWKGDKKLPLADAVSTWRDYLKQFPSPLPLLLEFMPMNTLEELTAESAALETIIGGSL